MTPWSISWTWSAARFYDKVMADRGNQIRMSVEFIPQPLADVHFRSDLGYDEATVAAFFLRQVLRASTM